MKYVSIICLAILLNSNLLAQIQYEGSPINWEDKSTNSLVNFVAIPVPDMSIILAEDKVVDQYKATPYRFGVEMDVDINFFDQADLEVLPSGDKVYRFGLHCPEATSINFFFDAFSIPEGGKIFIYNETKSEYLGAFTSANMKDHGGLGIGLIHDDQIVIEYYEPQNATEIAQLSISKVTYGYRQVINKNSADKGPFGNSQSCNININCPDANPWQDEKRSVGLLLSGGFVCTGSLVNNVNNNGIPYFLTAEHCGGGEAGWVVYFNHEYSSCTNAGAAPTNQSISGATVKGTNPTSDGHLVQLSQNIPLSYNPYFNGWDKSGTSVSLGVGIHHPAGDVKKISFDDDPVQRTFYLQSNSSSVGNNWRIDQWERNTTTEGGSSGSPLYDQNHRVIGQLQGGFSACDNNSSDWYGAFHASFPFYSEFLANGSSTVQFIDGYDPLATPQTNFVLKTFLEGPLVPIVPIMEDGLRQTGNIPLTEPFTALGYTHVGGGGETINSSVLNVSASNAIVDWILVEVRSSLNSAIVLATQSALLQRDGDIVSVDGTSPVTIDNLTGTVRVAIRHRNHFGMRTTNTYSTTGDIVIDFTDPNVPLLGGDDAMTTYGNVRAMIAGDANNDGQINTIDKNNFWRLQNGNPYNYFTSPADFDLNSTINTVDKNSYWRINNSKAEFLD